MKINSSNHKREGSIYNPVVFYDEIENQGVEENIEYSGVEQSVKHSSPDIYGVPNITERNLGQYTERDMGRSVEYRNVANVGHGGIDDMYDEILRSMKNSEQGEGVRQSNAQSVEQSSIEHTDSGYAGRKSNAELIGDRGGKKETAAINPQIKLTIYDWLQSVVTAILLGLMLFIFVGRTIGVDGISMYQTLRHNDRIIISNLFYTPDNGDIIVFESSSERFEHPLVKRVIAIAGQWVDIDFETGEVFVDGEVIYEPYIDVITSARHNFDGPVFVPEGYVFVLGDNRNHSSDSRDNEIGVVDTRYILGKVLFIWMPGEDNQGNRDWSRFGFVS